MRHLLRCTLLVVSLPACNELIGVSDVKPRPEAPSAGASSGPGAGCTTNAQCLQKTGEFDPSACVEGECVKLFSPDCPLLLPQTERAWLENLRSSEPDPVIIGVFSYVPTELFGLGARIFDLALTEVTRTAGGVPTVGGKRRPLVAVVCRNVYEEPERFDRAIDHLIDTVKVSAVLSALDTSDLIHAYRRRGQAGHVFFLSTSSAEQTLIDLDDNDLVWSVLPGGKELARVYPALVGSTLEHLRRTGALAEGEDVRVALVRADNIANLSETAGALSELVEFNGRPASENDAEHFRAFSIISGATGQTPSDYGSVLAQLIDFEPHLIISAAASEFATHFIPRLELESENWRQRPTYLLSAWNAYDAAVLQTAQSFEHVGLRTRMLGVNFAAAADKSLYDAYQDRFDAANPSLAGTQGLENYYDAAYYLVYAAVAAGPGSRLIGPDFALGMQRLLAGQPTFGVGPDDLSAAFQALQDPNAAITLNGTMGPPDFDPETGARATAGTVWCIDERYKVVFDVLRLNDAGRLVGNFPCFPFP